MAKELYKRGSVPVVLLDHEHEACVIFASPFMQELINSSTKKRRYLT